MNSYFYVTIIRSLVYIGKGAHYYQAKYVTVNTYRTFLPPNTMGEQSQPTFHGLV